MSTVPWALLLSCPVLTSYMLLVLTPGPTCHMGSADMQVEALGSESAAWEEVIQTCAVAVAADTTKPLEELGPADWEIMEVSVWNDELQTRAVSYSVRT